MNDSTFQGEAGQAGLGPQAVSLLCSRLCHDLISPVSAVNHGAELLTELAPNDSEARQARELVADSAERAGDRLQLQRLAFAGMAERGGVRASALVRLAHRCLPKHVALQWSDAAEAALDAAGGPAIKLAANLVQIAAEMVGGRGRVAVAVSGDGQTLSLTATGAQAGLDAGRAAALRLAVAEAALTTETVLPYHAATVARYWGYTLTWQAVEPSDGSGGAALMMGLSGDAR